MHHTVQTICAEACLATCADTVTTVLEHCCTALRSLEGGLTLCSHIGLQATPAARVLEQALQVSVLPRQLQQHLVVKVLGHCDL